MVRHILRSIVIGFILLLASAQSIEAPPGDIGPIIIWDDDITLTENYTVEFYQTLIIQPDVTVYLDEDVSIIINGSLTAEGNKNEYITFTHLEESPSEQLWGNILFTQYSDEKESIIKYVKIEYATNGVWFSGCSQEISNSIIQNCSNGIYIDNPTWKGSSAIIPIIINNSIMNNWNGIRGIGRPEVTNNEIILNQYGINISGFVIWDSGIPIIRNNLIQGNYIGIDAWSIWTLVDPTIENNTISFNDIGISLYAHFTGGNATATIFNNDIINNSMDGISLGFATGNITSNNISSNGGDGIDLFCSNPTISHNRITYNGKYGIFIDTFSDPNLINNFYENNTLGATNINGDNDNPNPDQNGDTPNSENSLSSIAHNISWIIGLIVIFLIILMAVILIILRRKK